MMCNNPKLDLAKMNAYIKFGEILPIGSQDIEGYSRKKYLGGEEGKGYIFLCVVGADIFQIIWVIGV